MNLYDELVSVVRALDDAGVEYALVGGLAVSVWGAPRATKDIDLLVRREALEAAKGAVRGCGYALEALPMTFPDGMEVHRVNKAAGDGLMTVDFLLVDRNLEPVWASRERRGTESGPLWVAGRAALIAMKLAAGRAQDQADVLRLEEQDR